MTKRAKKLSAYLSLAVIPFGAAMVKLARSASPAKQVGIVDATQESDGAYRDGVFLGSLDAENDRKVRPSVGRWNDPKDRASFLAGYQRGYRETLAAKVAKRRH